MTYCVNDPIFAPTPRLATIVSCAVSYPTPTHPSPQPPFQPNISQHIITVAIGTKFDHTPVLTIDKVKDDKDKANRRVIKLS